MEVTYFGENNAMMIFVITLLSIIAYTNFTEAQRFFLIYLLSYGTVFWDILSLKKTLLILFIATFIYLEYLTEDTTKIEIIINLRHKLLDYCYMMSFQFHVFWILLSFAFLWIHEHKYFANDIPLYCSLFFLFWGENNVIAQKFKIASISDISHIFLVDSPLYSYKHSSAKQRKHEILCAFEDKSYLQRRNSYSCISLEYLDCLSKRLVAPLKESGGIRRKIKLFVGNLTRTIIIRGYSTPEMQLIRTIGVIRGYERYKISRKIFEVLYSKILFSSLLNYYKANTFKGLENFRHYLLDVYISCVPVRIRGNKYPKMGELFAGKTYENWSDEEMFVACLGLRFLDVKEETLAAYNDIILNYHLDKSKIKAISDSFKK